MRIFAEAARLEKNNQPFAFVQIIESKGSTPRHNGHMLVTITGETIDTIGGGMLERHVIEQAIEALKEGKSRVYEGQMSRTGVHAVGSDCGGAVKVFIEVYQARPKLILIGAGHVNRAIAHVAKALNFDIYIIDTFEKNLDKTFFPDNCHLLAIEEINQLAELPIIDEESFVVIATNHQDKEALSLLINKTVNYLGLLSSHKKLQTFLKSLRQEGVDYTAIQKLHAPIGLNIGAETPEEIAVSVMAEIIKMKQKKSGIYRKKCPAFHYDKLVVIRGAGDIATGVAYRLFQCGFPVILLEQTLPTAIRLTVSFAQAIFNGSTTIEQITASKADDINQAYDLLLQNKIPVLIDPTATCIEQLNPTYLIDAMIAKKNLGTHKNMAPITIALGPGFHAGIDCHAVIETHRGHDLGKVIYQGSAQKNTGIPGSIANQSILRVIKAPCAGILKHKVKIGNIVKEGDTIALIDNTPIVAPISGLIRGLLHEGLTVTASLKISDIDPRGHEVNYQTISDKARAIAGGVIEAMLHLSQQLTK